MRATRESCAPFEVFPNDGTVLVVSHHARVTEPAGDEMSCVQFLIADCSGSPLWGT